MRVSQAIGAALVDLGVRDVFGIVGSGNFRLTEAARAAGARFASARQETSAVAMADGYAAATGRPGVATVHQGPGYTNAITGMIEAAKSRSQVLLIAADTPATWTHSNFRVDQASIAEAGEIHVVRVGSAETVVDDLTRAWRLVVLGRRATVLLVPLDVADAEIDGPLVLANPVEEAPVPPEPSDVKRAIELISGARRPVIVAGRGAVRAGAGPALARLAEHVGAPLATSVVAHGLFAGHPLSIGISGGFATPLAAELIGAADVILAMGVSLGRWTTRHGRLIADEAQIVQVDEDPEAIGRHHAVALGVNADARLAAEALADAAPRDRAPDAVLVERIAASRWRDVAFDDASTGSTIDPRTATLALDAILPRERLVVVDGGHFSGWPAMYLEPPDARGFLFHQAFQAIGLGLGTAIGAARGSGDRTVVAAVGDGGAFMALGELETAARLGLPMIVLVYNDDAYGAEVHHFADDDVPMDTVRFGPTDVAAIAEATGALGVTVRRLDDLDRVRTWVERRPERPLVVDLKVTPTVVGAWLPEAFRA
jgi:thiamine pyrophosphate-dependent acetolactate synthase large subunit-like protein